MKIVKIRLKAQPLNAPFDIRLDMRRRVCDCAEALAAAVPEDIKAAFRG